MANIEQVVADAAEKLTRAVEAYGPKATELVLETGRVAALQDIVRGLVFAAVCAICVLVVILCLKKAAKISEYDERKPVLFTGALFVGLGAIASLLCTGSYLINVSAWVGLYHPEIYLATKLLGM